MALLHPVLVAALVASCIGAASGQPASEAQRNATLAALLAQRDAISNWDAFAAANNITGWDASQPDYCQWGGPLTNCTDGNLDTLDFSCDPSATVCLPAFGCVPYDACAEPLAKGALSPALANISTLRKLIVKGQDISGSLPPEWAAPGAFPSLTDLPLSNNSISGTLPEAWGRPGAFPKLYRLWMDDNRIEGTLPASWANTTGNTSAFPTLSYLKLNGNRLTGPVPGEWNASGALPRVKACPFAKQTLLPPRMCVIELADNPGLCGPVPPTLQEQICGSPDNNIDGQVGCTGGSIGACPARPPAAAPAPAPATSPPAAAPATQPPAAAPAQVSPEAAPAPPPAGGEAVPAGEVVPAGDEATQSGGGSSNTGAIVGGIVAGLVVVGAVAAVVIVRRRRRHGSGGWSKEELEAGAPSSGGNGGGGSGGGGASGGMAAATTGGLQLQPLGSSGRQPSGAIGDAVRLPALVPPSEEEALPPPPQLPSFDSLQARSYSRAGGADGSGSQRF